MTTLDLAERFAEAVVLFVPGDPVPLREVDVRLSELLAALPAADREARREAEDCLRLLRQARDGRTVEGLGSRLERCAELLQRRLAGGNAAVDQGRSTTSWSANGANRPPCCACSPIPPPTASCAGASTALRAMPACSDSTTCNAAATTSRTPWPPVA